MTAYHGNCSAKIGEPGGSLYQSFAIPTMDELLFGAYFKISTTERSGNWDQTQINMQVTGLSPDTTIGGSVGNFPPVLFSWNATSGHYETDWFLVAGSVDLTSLSTFPTNAAININLQGYSDPTTMLWVDSAYAGGNAPVPEPATMLLFGVGLAGLAGYRRRQAKKK